jgi:hypothetical protein
MVYWGSHSRWAADKGQMAAAAYLAVLLDLNIQVQKPRTEVDIQGFLGE